MPLLLADEVVDGPGVGVGGGGGRITPTTSLRVLLSMKLPAIEVL
jgi:hypothetical protein